MSTVYRRVVRQRNLLCLAVSAAVTIGWALPERALASTFHVNGDTIYYSGRVLSEDPQTLEALLASARQQGRVIRQVVFRNSPGGAASGGVGMGAVIRRNGLDTVLDGGCFSACADAFVAGVNRRIVRFGLPVYGSYSGTELGIHGASNDDGPVPYPGQEEYIQYYRDMFGARDFATIEARITQAHYELTQQSGFLRYFDPAFAGGIATRFCPTGDTSAAGGCTDYPGVTLFSDRMATSADYAVTNDVLTLDGRLVKGDINPGFHAGQYEYLPVADIDKVAGSDTFGIIKLTGKSEWTADQDSGAGILWVDSGKVDIVGGSRVVTTHSAIAAAGAINVIAGRLKADSTQVSGLLGIAAGSELDNRGLLQVSRGGRVQLEGGRISTEYVTLDPGARLQGHGTVGGTALVEDPDYPLYPWNVPLVTRIRVAGGELRPQGGRLTVNGYVSFAYADAGTLAFELTPQTQQAGLVLGEFDVHRCESQSNYFACRRGAVAKAPGFLVGAAAAGARLALDVAPGYYRQDLSIPLVEGRIYGNKEGGLVVNKLLNDRNSAFDASVASLQPGQLAFTKAQRQDGSDYSADLGSADAAQRLFHPRHNSLLTFSIVQTGQGIWAVANPAFDDASVFSNAASGAGLGLALKAAAAQPTSALHPLLGVLQFADRDVVAQQAGALRGDAHASLRLADNALVGSIGNVVQQHQAALRSGGDADGLAAQVAQSVSAQPGIRNGSLFNQLAMHLVAPGDRAATGPATDAPARDRGVWARGFGSHGRIDAGDGVAGLSHTVGGVVIGADTRLAEGRVTLGASVAAANLSSKGNEGSGFSGDVRALDIGGYVDATYARGYLSAAVRYTDLRHETRRSIVGIDGLKDPLRARYSNDAISARLEHGLSFSTGKGLVIQPLLPVLDYARTSATRFDEGQGVGALVGRSGSLESLRVGAGLQLFKTFQGRKGERITPRARVVWQKELGDTQARYSTGFAAAPDLLFAASSQIVGEQLLAWNLGVTSHASERLSVMVDYVGERRDGQIQNGVMLGLGYRF